MVLAISGGIFASQPIMSSDRKYPSRRDAIAAAGLLTLAACKPGPRSKREATKTMNRKKMPCIFIPHGGGPWPWMPGQAELYSKLTSYLRGIPAGLPQTPTAIVCISAHWEESEARVLSHATPPMLYDYSGFPAETYKVQWSAPGASDLALEIQGMLSEKGIAAGLDQERGFDHGAFVPLAVSYPEATIPCIQISLVRGLDPQTHLAMGRALAPLRQRGVLLLGSGMSYHNMGPLMQAMRGGPKPLDESLAFDNWLGESMMLEASKRDTQLVEWAKAPMARECHPREEHLLPLHVIAGAAGDDLATLPFRGEIIGAHVSAVQFG